MNVPKVGRAETNDVVKDTRKAHYLIDLSQLCNLQQVVSLLIASATTGDEWTLAGSLPASLHRTLVEGRVRHTLVESLAYASTDVLDMTEAMIRLSEVERGTARYVCESPVGGIIAIVYQNFRYRVLIGAESYGAFATPEAALVALTDESLANFMTEAGPKLGEYQVPSNLREWSLMRVTAPHGGDILSTTAGGAGSVGFMQAAQKSIVQ